MSKCIVIYFIYFSLFNPSQKSEPVVGISISSNRHENNCCASCTEDKFLYQDRCVVRIGHREGGREHPHPFLVLQ